MARDVADTVRRYFETVADLDSTADDLTPLLDPDVLVTEHPNAITPGGARRGLDETLAGFAAGKALLSAQSIEIHDVMVVADRAAVRATWSGTVGIDAGRLAKGSTIVAELGAFLTVRDGLIVEHETFDCYVPF